MMLSRDQLLAPRTPPRETVSVPELEPGGVLLLQGLTLAGRDEWESSVVQQRGKNVEVNRANIRARLIVRCIVDDSGKRVLTDDDAPLIGYWPGDVGERVFTVCQRLSGLGTEDVEQLAGNSERGQPA